MTPRPTLLALLAALALTTTPARAQIQLMHTYATVPGPQGLAFDPSGNLFVTSGGPTHGLYKVPPGGGAGVLFANAGFVDVWGVVCDASGNVFVADRNATVANGGRIWKVSPAGVVSTLASGLPAPCGLAIDASGNLYAGSYNGQKILRITPAGVVTNHATGLGVPGNQTNQIEIEPDGTIYAGNEARILRISPGGSPVTEVVGNLLQALGFVHWIEDNFIVSTFGHGRLLFAQPAPRGTPAVAITSLVLADQCTDGVMPAGARVNQTAFMKLHDDKVYFADQGCNKVRWFSLSGADGPVPALKRSWSSVKSQYR